MEFFLAFYENLFEAGLSEIIAVIFGLVSVILARKANILVYPTGIISVGIYVYLCYKARLYADMGINVVFFLMSVYGWYQWARKTNDTLSLKIRFCTLKQNIVSLTVCLGIWVILFFILDLLTNSDVPVTDALTTAIFMVGMFLMALKKVENWIYWIVGDLISIPLYFSKHLYFTSIQFLIFSILAIFGWLEWKKLSRVNA